MVLSAESGKLKAQRKRGPVFAFQLPASSFELRDDIGLWVRPALDMGVYGDDNVSSFPKKCEAGVLHASRYGA